MKGVRVYIYLTLSIYFLTLYSCGTPTKREIISGKNINDIVNQTCGSCHSLRVGSKDIATSDTEKKIVLLSGKSKEDWERTVLRMIEEYGCNVEGGTGGKLFKRIVEYLAREAGPNVTVNKIPDEDEKLIQTACGTCHGLVIVDVYNDKKIIKRISKSPIGGDIKLPTGKEDWTQTVVRMIEKNKCAIPGGVGGEVFRRIVNWLNANAGKDIGKHLDPYRASGKELTEVYCSICHGIKINGVEVTKAFWNIELPNNKDLKGWKATIEKMIYKNNCPVPGGINGPAIEKIAEYLYYLNIPEPDLKDKTGEELVSMFCNQCHGLVVGNVRITINSIGVDVVLLDGKVSSLKNDWNFTVSRMIEVNGCPVPGGVNDCTQDPTTPFCKIVSFLETNFGAGCCGNVNTWDDEKIVKAVCGSCHGIRGYSKVLTVSPGLDMWLFDGKSQEEWEFTVRRMININGALIPGGVGGDIYNRIVQWFTVNAGQNCCGYIPTEKPELIAQAACGTCHGIVIGSRSNNKRLTRGMSLYLGIVYGWDAVPLGKDEMHWTKTINRMILRRIATRGSIPDLKQKKAMIDWFVKEAGIEVYNDPGSQGLRDPRELFMTYCHKCHGPRARGSELDTSKQWITTIQLGDPPLNGIFYPNPLDFLDPGYMSGWWWPPSGDFFIMPYYMWHKYSYGYIDRRVHPDEWSVLRTVVNYLSNKYKPQSDTPFLPAEGDSDGDGTIDFPLDTARPPAPVNVNISKTGNKITLEWTSVNEKDLNGYLLFYANLSDCSSDCSNCTNWVPVPTVKGNPDSNVTYQKLIFENKFTLSLPQGNWCVGVASVDYTCPRPRSIDAEDPLNLCGFNMKTAGPINIP